MKKNEPSNKKQLIVLASPSGGGKSTIARYLMKKYPSFQFSISATTRKSRPRETYGIEYFFMSKEEFEKKIDAGEFVEYEEIFGNYYGTLHSEINKALICNENLLFDIDVKGALSIKKAYPKESLLIFIAPPSIEELEHRLRLRSTETEEQIQTRLARAKMELAEQDKFDYIIINKELEKAFQQIDEIIEGNVEIG